MAVVETPRVAFLRALSEENLEEIRELAERDSGLLTEALRDGLMALQLAAGAGKEMVVNELLALGAESNAIDETGKRPLHYAASAHIAEMLLEAGADPNGRDTVHACMPLHTVTSRKVAAVLVSAGADINAGDEHQRTPLHLAAAMGSLRMVRFLLSRKADPNARDDRQRTPLQLAKAKGHPEIVSLLTSLTQTVCVPALSNAGMLPFESMPPRAASPSYTLPTTDIAFTNTTRTAVMEPILLAPEADANPEVTLFHEDDVEEVEVPRDYARQIGQLADGYRGVPAGRPASQSVAGDAKTGSLFSEILGAQRPALLIGLILGLLPSAILAVFAVNRIGNTPRTTTATVLAEEHFVHPIANLSLAQVKNELSLTLDYRPTRDLPDMSTVIEQGVVDLPQHSCHALLNIYRSGQQENTIYGFEFTVDAEAQAGMVTPSTLDSIALSACTSVLALTRFTSEREAVTSWLNEALQDSHAATTIHAISLHGLRFACYGSPWTRTLEVTAN